MKVGYLKRVNQFKLEDVPNLPAPSDDEALIEVKACGFCGHEKILAATEAEDWEPFGHELSGIVLAVGQRVSHLKVGDHVVLQTSTFNPYSRQSINGRVDLDDDIINFVTRDPGRLMGWAEQMLVPAALAVPFTGISFVEACMIEPFGVAYDMVKRADIHLNHDVMVLGLGPIGLMALQLARLSGARTIYAVDRSWNKRKMELAVKFGADEVIASDLTPLSEIRFLRKGVDRILLSTPPQTIGHAVECLNLGGILSYIGIAYGEQAMVTFNANTVHLKKLEIRGANAVPALYFPDCIEWVRAGKIDLESIVSDRFSLEDSIEGLKHYLNNKEHSVKAVMFRDG